ncbi:hypothetical protein F5Y13DRAFT_189794 [Hypoxylon sp. FL1857]|nr:hypothetical protein F5Y13DRAFT_189794 [Hypoxylon sp. FL1857]
MTASMKIARENIEKAVTDLNNSSTPEDILRNATAAIDRAVAMERVLVDETKRPCVIVFGIPTAGQLDDTFKSDSVGRHFITKDATLLSWMEAIVDSSPKIVFIDPDVPAVLYIPRVVAIVSRNYPDPIIFDTRYGQFARTAVKKSRMDVLMQQSYALKSSPSEAGSVNFYMPGVEASAVPNFDKGRLVSQYPAYNSELMRLALELSCPWPDPGRHSDNEKSSLPQPPMLDYPLLDEAIRRLITMGSLKAPLSVRDAIRYRRGLLNGPRGERTLQFLNMPCNPEKDVSLAYFLAGIQDAQSDSLRRVMIRIGSLMSKGPFGVVYSDDIMNRLQDDAYKSQEDVEKYRECVRAVRQAVAPLCQGIGAQQFGRGGVWIALGLFLAMEKAKIEGLDMKMFEGRAATIDRKSFREAFATVRFLEHIFGLEPSNDVIRDTTLNVDDLLAVYNNLMNSWMSQVVYFRRHRGLDAKDLTSFQHVKVAGFPSVDVLGRFEKDQRNCNDAIFAFYTTCIRGPNGQVEVFNLTELPHPAFIRLIRDKGLEFNMTRYPL